MSGKVGFREDSYRSVGWDNLIGNADVVSYNDYDAFGMQLDGRCGSNGEAYDKYKFTGKERDTETDYDYFDAATEFIPLKSGNSWLGRWMQGDPLAEKYPGWSPYNYTMDNSISKYDVDGNYVKVRMEKFMHLQLILWR